MNMEVPGFSPRSSHALKQIIVFTCSLLSTSAATAAWQPLDIQDEQALLSPPEIRVRNGTLYYDGKITAGSAVKVIAQLNMRRVDKISLNSIGGDASEAIDIGREIFRRKLDVEVRNVCASACANYLFPAGKNKFIGKESYLLWHGSPRSQAREIALEQDDDNMTAEKMRQRKVFTDLQQKETAFYQLTGISEKMVDCPQLRDDSRQKFPGKWFSWSPASLHHFGVQHIYFYGTNAARWQQSMSGKGVIFADYCQ